MFADESVARPISILLSYGFQWFLFLLPGFSICARTAGRLSQTAVQSVITIVLTGAVLGYLSFWAFFAHRAIGRSFTMLVYAAAVILVVEALLRRPAAVKGLVWQVGPPFALVLISGMFYLSCFYLFEGPHDPGASLGDIRFFEAVRPGDNLIPEIFADKIYRHEPLRPFCCGDWLSSDRPPLQSGIFLLLRPLRIAGSAGLQYQVLSTVLQCLWICGVWSLLTALNTPAKRSLQLLVPLIFSGFLFYNSVYVWPKLMAATFILFAICILLQILRSGRATHVDFALGSISVSLALLAHPGSVFSLFAFLLVVVSRWRTFKTRKIIPAAVLGICLLLPWTAYQHFVDPPGNRLLKMHLAGVFDVDQRSFARALVDSYRQHSISQIARFKFENFKTLFGPKPLDSMGLSAFRFGPGIHLDRAAIERSRVLEREYIWNAVGWLNLGWIVLAVSLVRGRKLPRSAVTGGHWLIIAAIVNLLFWCLLDFGPGETFTTHSSYADLLLLEVGLGGWMLALPAGFVLIILGLQVFSLFAVWVLYPPVQFFSSPVVMNVPFLVAALVSACSLLGIFFRSTYKQLTSPDGPDASNRPGSDTLRPSIPEPV
ncbi:MAG: hypothetical protein JO108_31415 [Acidobacteriaceae bacterium]|nr:hypothetical protein [Acidobacteriaceae bacterium]